MLLHKSIFIVLIIIRTKMTPIDHHREQCLTKQEKIPLDVTVTSI